MDVVSQGGDGGDGGAARSTKSYRTYGGDGGTGGDGGDIQVTVSGSFNLEPSQDFVDAIYISSSGGNGGNGGYGHVSDVSHGGDGGRGGDGGDVVFEAAEGATITSDEDEASPIIVQSVAGDGGDGGGASNDVGSSHGGEGGSGGVGGDVTVDLTAADSVAISTEDARGILARSYGGAGGDGGDADSGLGAGHGGDGASSGNGGDVKVYLTGQLYTIGDDADAIVAQSVGGFAGDGGTANGIVAYGASSDSAGTGGAVDVMLDGEALTTFGDHSDAIFAQSVGGGGGSGSSSLSAFDSLGGSGSAGGQAGAVSVETYTSAISTFGDRSRGIFAQSIGGGGGDGGSATGLYSVGGSGSLGGSGETVDVYNIADIRTFGEYSEGILAQSVGGGGGSGASTEGMIAIGGDGGDGATSDDVTVENAGTVYTVGDHSDAILVQSIGGSGGKGSSSTSLGTAFALAIAGDGGEGGDAGDAYYSDASAVDESGSAYGLETVGDMSNGLVVQSIGGGGGHGGNALALSTGVAFDVSVSLSGDGAGGGNGGDVQVGFQGSVTTKGDHSIGILANSTGGAGGSAGTSIAVASSVGALTFNVGYSESGDGGNGGDGGVVTVCRGTDTPYTSNCSTVLGDDTIDAGSLQTYGDGSPGVVASSIGGGGGHSGTTISGSVVSTAAVNLAVGGGGGKGGSGGEVFVYSSGEIYTDGMSSGGIIAKSVGGSGGAAYLSAAVSGFSSESVNLAVGGQGGDAGDSSDVTVVSTDETIFTWGSSSAGIQAMSIGGSGGDGGVAISASAISTGSLGVSLGGDGGAGGAAGDVKVYSYGGAIFTAEDLSGGVVAISSGGSGGSGGFDFSGGVASAASVDISVGGSGGGGGAAGFASVDNEAAIATDGDMSPGISASSIGGSGGRGGGSMSSTLVSQGNASITLGGDGGSGGAGSYVEVTNKGAIATHGSLSEGIVAQSIGGNGGAGGFAAEAGITVSLNPDIPAGSMDITVGGDGGGSGASQDAAVYNYADVVTEGFGSTGILAQSIGGSGGAGGSAYSGTANLATSGTTLNVQVTVGGEGGGGGSSGDVTVTNAEGVAVTTSGDDSHAIFAQSVGGNGGRGGSAYNVLLKLQDESDNNANVSIAVGGAGGKGSVPGDVSVENNGDITTTGGRSSGVYAQSVGGNGGSGGSGGNIIADASVESASGEDEAEDADGGSSVSASINIAVGGTAGDGALAGAVEVTNGATASITTSGMNSHGIFAHSVGGGGGDGGSASNYSLSVSGICDFTVVALANANCDDDDEEDSGSTEFSFTGQFGGSGGEGGHGEDVTVTNEGAIETTGLASHGIFAQSVGGGGGYGGSAAPGFDTFTTNETLEDIDEVYGDATDDDPYTKITTWTDYTLSIGGSGGAGGDGGDVEVANSASISTSGNGSYGIYAQSVGGGGGSAGSASGEDNHSLTIGGDGEAAGDGGTVSVINESGASIAIEGDRALGIFAQSIGGGGGDSNFEFTADDVLAAVQFSYTIGGANGAGGDGNDVTITNTDTTITTTGLNSSAIFAQSIGGGGGTVLGALEGADGDVSVGGSGQASGDGGDVTVTHSGSISTAMDTDAAYNVASFGVFAQSVGGGGGYAGSVQFGPSEFYGTGLDGMSTSDVSSFGDGGDVTVTVNGDITTKRGASVGIFAQSVGGGGGVGGQADGTYTSDPEVYIGNGGGDGMGGTVSVVYESGTITTYGVGSHGIFAQSAGGPSAGTSGATKVSVDVSGDIIVSGEGAHGIFAQSVGEGMGKIAVTIAEGATVQGGKASAYSDGEDGAGVFIKNGTDDNTVVNNGTITSVLGTDGVAINVMDTTVSVTNNGSITGNWLKASEIHLVNGSEGEIYAGELMDVDTFLNHGVLELGEAGSVSMTTITGDYTQSSTGKIILTLDPGHEDELLRLDNLVISGDAEINGVLQVLLAEDWSPDVGQQVLSLLSVEGELIYDELELITSAVGQYALIEGGLGDLHLQSDIHFANDDILAEANANQEEIASTLHALYVSEHYHDTEFRHLIAIEDAEAYVAALDSFGAEVLLDNQVANILSAVGFRDDMIGCQGLFKGGQQDDHCVWVSFEGENLEGGATSNSLAYNQHAWQITGGGERNLDNGWTVGGGFSFESSSLSVAEASASGSGQQFRLGLAATREFSLLDLSGIVTGGIGSYDYDRNPFLGDPLNATQTMGLIGGKLEASRTVEIGDWYVRPRGAIGFDYLSTGDYNEYGENAYALRIEGSDEVYTNLQAGLDIGAQFTLGSGVIIRPTVSAGVTRFLGDASPSATAQFQSSPSYIPDFTSTANFDQTYLDLSAGLDVLATHNTAIRAQVGGSFSESTTRLGGQLKFSVNF
ncbi:autotransporter outer membrane beta-barrel domain-containing protein [Hoeflea sp. CAU 1731]